LGLQLLQISSITIATIDSVLDKFNQESQFPKIYRSTQQEAKIASTMKREKSIENVHQESLSIASRRDRLQSHDKVRKVKQPI